MINVVDNAAGIVLGRSALNNPIKNYAFDSRVNLTLEDPHASNYVLVEQVTLESTCNITKSIS